MLSIGSPELLAFTLFGMSMVATLSGRAPLKGLTAAGLGLMISMIGSRAQSGTLRWTFDWLYLWDGVPLIPATLGIFAIPELAELAVSRKRIAGDNAPEINLSSQWEGVRDVGRNWWLVLRCGVLGTGLGAIPGIGSAVIDWIAYGYAQRTEKNSETFGTGDVRGVIAPEASNNAKEGGHLVPTIAFGVPAGASMAILLGAFLMHGLTPGPDMLTKHLDLTYMIVWSLTLAHVIGAVICILCSGWLAQISRVRPEILLPVIIALVFVAAFDGEHDWGDLYSLLFFGVIGWIMKRLGWPRPPMVLGIVVGAIFERYLFISTQLYGWGWLYRPAVLGILACVVWALYRPLSQIVTTLVTEFRHVGGRKARFGAASAFSLAVIVLIVAAIISSADWPHDAKLVPLTACGMALVAAVLNLVYELFGPQQAVVAHADSGVKVQRPCQRSRRHRRRGAAACGRLLPLARRIHRPRRADRLHPGDRGLRLRLYEFRLWRAETACARLCARHDAAVLGRVPVGPASGLAAIAARRLLPGAARGDAADLTPSGYFNATAAFFTTSGGVR